MGYSNQEVCHLWASANKDSATSNHGNVYFTGPRLYSYGSHFMLGYIVAPRVAFLNSDGYSISTSKHKGYAASAVSHYTTFYLPKLQNFESFLNRLSAHIREPRRGADLKALRNRVEADFAAYLAKYPNGPRDGWQWAFEQVGIGSRFATAERKAGRIKAKEAAEAEREAVATWRADGKQFADMSLSEFAGVINAARHNENGYRGLSDLEHLADKLHRAHKQANRDGFTRRKVTLWQRLASVRAAIRAFKESGVTSYNSSRLSRAVRAIANVRTAARAWPQLDGLPGPHAFESLASQVQTALLLAGHMPPATRRTLEGYLAALLAARDTRALAIERERFDAEQEERRAWLAGERVYTRARLSDERGGALVRAVGAELDGCKVIAGELETSHGARVPLAHAARVFAFVRRIRERGEGWEADSARPVRVGHYQLDRVEPSGDFVAGCHRINWNETERLARELGLWDCAPAELAD